MLDVEAMVREETAKAEEKFGPFHSSHEGLGVLIEEVDELREAIRSNIPALIQKEAVQVASVASRIAKSMRRLGCR